MQKDYSDVRVEHDALGSMALAHSTTYGIQTARAVENFSISDKTIADVPDFVLNIVRIKKAAAIANRKIGVLPFAIAGAIEWAANHVGPAFQPGSFPVDIYHGGGGTSANMNVNEVLARLASERLTGEPNSLAVHPNNDVNMGQSTNDVIPSAMKMTAYRLIGDLQAAVVLLTEALEEKAVEFSDVVKLGRTCLQDALPLTLGQQFSGYREAMQRHATELSRVRQMCLTLPLGGTAVGTQFGTFPGYCDAVYDALHVDTGERYKPEHNFFDAFQNADSWISISSAMKALAVTLNKLCSDLRIMSSGPRAGLAEIELPSVQPGSSMMPGKINPVIPEMVIQVYFRVLGNDLSVTRACEGELDLNVWESLILNCVSESATLLTRAIPLLASKCILGIRANSERCRANAENSPALATVIATLFDYDTATSIAKQATSEGRTIKEVVIERGVMSAIEAQTYLDPEALASRTRFEALFGPARIDTVKNAVI